MGRQSKPDRYGSDKRRDQRGLYIAVNSVSEDIDPMPLSASRIQAMESAHTKDSLHDRSTMDNLRSFGHLSAVHSAS